MSKHNPSPTTKKLFIKHDFNAMQDKKHRALMRRHGAKGYGIFWAMLELMANEPDGILTWDALTIETFCYDVNEKPESVQEVIDACCGDLELFIRDGDNIRSQRLCDWKAEMEASREKKSKAGKRSADLRSTPVEHLLNTCSREKEEEQERESEKEEREPKRKRFVPPELADCIAYGRSIGLSIDECEAFRDSKISNGWKVGKSPMLDWKAAMRTWKRNAAKFNREVQRPGGNDMREIDR